MAPAATTTTPRTGLILALLAAVLVGQFASPVEAEKILENCVLTDVDGDGVVETLVVASDITKLKDRVCQSNTNIKAVDFSKATILTKIGDYAFQGSKLTGDVDLRNLQNLVELGRSAFETIDGMTSVDISNCTKLGYVGTNCFYNNKNLESIVARNVGRDGSNKDDLSITQDNLNTYGDLSGALMFGQHNFPDNPKLALFDFRGTAVGQGQLFDRKWANGNSGNSNPPPLYADTGTTTSPQWGATLSYQKCKVINNTKECCFDANDNTFTAVSNAPSSKVSAGTAIPATTCTPATCASAPSEFTCGAGSTPKTGTPSCSDDPCAAEDFASGGSCCEASTNCTGTWSDCSESCEAAADRTWTVTTPKAGLGLPCPAAGSGPSCAVNDGNCTSIGLQGQSSQTSVAMFPAMAAMILASAIALLCTAG